MTDPTRPATGYPAQPTTGYPPPQQQNSYYYPNHNPYNAPPPYYPPSPRAAFFRRFMSALIACFIILGAVLFIVWLVLRPRVPIFTVDSFSLSSLNISTSTSEISATWNARFTVVNPNDKLHVYYDEIMARLSYRTSLVAQNELQPFDQGTKNRTVMVAKLVAASAYIDPETGKQLSEDRSKGSVKFAVELLAATRFKSGGWRARRRVLRVICDDLSVSVTANASNGTLSGGPRRCSVAI